jgi:hypothetical protein
MHRQRLRALALVLATLLALCGLAACSSDDGGDDEASSGGDAGSGGSCADAVFEGDLSRDSDPSNPEHEPVTLTGEDIVSGTAVSAGSSYTVYLASYELDDGDLGATLVAPEGEVLATANLPAEGTADATNVFLTVDSGAGAISSGVVSPDVEIDVIDASADQVCMTVDIQKDYESLQGTFSVPVAQT